MGYKNLGFPMGNFNLAIIIVTENLMDFLRNGIKKGNSYKRNTMGKKRVRSVSPIASIFYDFSIEIIEVSNTKVGKIGKL